MALAEYHQRAHYPACLGGATLKPRAQVCAADAGLAKLPRLFRRGHIEAARSFTWTPAQFGLPRLFRRGHIEAVSASPPLLRLLLDYPACLGGATLKRQFRLHFTPQPCGLPRLFRRGHIEAYALASPPAAVKVDYPACLGGATLKLPHSPSVCQAQALLPRLFRRGHIEALV